MREPAEPTPGTASERREAAVTFRALLVGVAVGALVTRWIHEAELVVGGRGHSALANTSIPLGSFGGLLLVLGLNALVRRVLPRFALRRGELLTIYVMMTTSTVIASSGGIHFLVSAILAPHYFATPENHLDLLVPYIPKWFFPQGAEAVQDFYRGNATVPWRAWLMPTLNWTAFLLAFAGCTVSLSALLRRQWVDRERLTFPTVILPLEMTREGGELWRAPVLWIGFAIALTVGLINNLHANLPIIPDLNVRYIPVDQGFTGKFTNAMRPVGISFYPFVIGIGFLLSLDVTLSCWLFYLIGKLEAGLGATIGFTDASANLGAFPYLNEQGTGAFLALAVFSFWFARGTFREMLSTAFGRGPKPLDDSEEPLSYRSAFLLLLACFGVLLFYCAQAKMLVSLAAVVFALSLAVLVAATRIRAETGNAWLFGPTFDPHRLILTVTRGRLRLSDLTIMAYLRSLSNWDLRCQSMPHQLDAFKIAEAARLRARPLTLAILLAIAVGVPIAWSQALGVWYDQGALARAEPWRTTMGRTIFEEVMAQVMSPPRGGTAQLLATGAGFLVTLALVAARTLWVACPLHPVGYAMAGTQTMRSIWMPFFLAWLIKSLVLRIGGMRLYRRAIPFFLGLILGDFICGAGATLIACFAPTIKVYPINW